MSITSKPRRFYAGLALSAALNLAACIQGPWDYYPRDPEIYRGLYASGYVLAGKPVQHVCFERVLDLSEEATEAFAFYDTADVRIQGRFSGTEAAMALTAVVDTPNCFQGDPAKLAELGQDYAMTARFVWDSAGTRVTNVITGTAHMPDSFSVHDSAEAPSLARKDRGGVPDTLTPAFIASLPPKAKAAFAAVFGDTLGKLAGDTVATRKFYLDNNKAMQAVLLPALQSDRFVYHENDTLLYLNGAFNTLSHYFSDNRSPDVKAILITQSFEPNSERPETRFDSPVGIKPDSSEYYFPGYIRRLILYQDAKSKKGGNLLDSVAVVNVWFHTLRNRLYFYGFEQAYYDYIATTIENAGADVRVKPKYNVAGGRGFFAAGIPDSFDLYIIKDSLTKAYPLQVTHGLFCEKDGWADSKDCREYYPAYCGEKKYAPAECAPASVSACLLADLHGDSTAKGLCAPVADTARNNPKTAQSGEDQFCAEQGFDHPACAGARSRCLETSGANACKRTLWDFCLDHAWNAQSFPQCGPGLASYCHDKPRLSETLCRHADAYCAEHAESVLCK